MTTRRQNVITNYQFGNMAPGESLWVNVYRNPDDAPERSTQRRYGVPRDTPLYNGRKDLVYRLRITKK